MNRTTGLCTAMKKLSCSTLSKLTRSWEALIKPSPRITRKRTTAIIATINSTAGAYSLPKKTDETERTSHLVIVCNDAYRDLEHKSEQTTGDGYDRVSLIADNSRVNFL